MKINKLKIDGNCPIDDFINIIDERHWKSLNTILSRIEFISHTSLDLEKRLREEIVEKKGRRSIGCVFKEKEMRVYCLYSFDAIDLVMGGWRHEHDANIRQLIEIASKIRDNSLIYERNTVNLKTMSL